MEASSYQASPSSGPPPSNPPSYATQGISLTQNVDIIYPNSKFSVVFHFLPVKFKPINATFKKVSTRIPQLYFRFPPTKPPTNPSPSPWPNSSAVVHCPPPLLSCCLPSSARLPHPRCSSLAPHPAPRILAKYLLMLQDPLQVLCIL